MEAWSLFALGAPIGMQHALDANHLAAVGVVAMAIGGGLMAGNWTALGF